MDQTNLRKANGEVKIDVKDFFWRLIEQWKGIVIFVLLFTLLVSGVEYARRSSANNAGSADTLTPETVESMLDSLDSYGRETVLSAFRENTDLRKLRDYIATSPYMSLDPYRVKTLSVSLFIDSDDEINRQLIGAYYNELDSSKVADEINKAWNSDYTSDQICELISVKSPLNSENDNDVQSSVFNLDIYIPEGFSPEAANEVIERLLYDISDDLKKSIGDHNISVISSDVKEISDKDFALEQYDIFTRSYNMQGYVQSLIDKMTPEQKAVYDALLSVEKYEENQDEEGKDQPAAETPIFSVKGIAVGLVFGCLLYGLVYMLYYVFSGKIFSSSNIEDTFGVRLLSEWYPGNKTGGLDAILRDKLVYKAHYKGHLDMDKEAKRTADSISNRLDKENGSRIVLVSNNDSDDNISAFAASLENELKNADIEVISSCVNMKKGISLSEQTLKESDGCVLLVDESVSGEKDIKDISDKCYYCNKPFIGAVFVR